ncbi:MAG: HAD family hydrolase [Nitrososphaeria archaeon]
MTYTHILFGLENTLYDADLQLSMARMNAVKAMVAEGLPLNHESLYIMLEQIVKEYGVHFPKHFDILIERLGVKYSPRIIAAGVLAYRETSAVYLKPYPDVQSTLLTLRDKGAKLYLITSGPPVKQWQKILSLNLGHLFHDVFIEERSDIMGGLSKDFLRTVLERFPADKSSVLAVSGLENEISVFKEFDIPSALVIRGASKYSAEKAKDLATYVIESLEKILKIV